ncbi:MAG: hypothetical protein WKF43_05660 [Acidimicrobiales bacterium]
MILSGPSPTGETLAAIERVAIGDPQHRHTIEAGHDAHELVATEATDEISSRRIERSWAASHTSRASPMVCPYTSLIDLQWSTSM